MISIQTKVLPWTPTKPKRIKAYTLNGHSLTLSVHRSNDVETHGYVANKLASRMHWLTPTNYLIGGATKEGYCFVFSDSTIIAPKDGPAS